MKKLTALLVVVMSILLSGCELLGMSELAVALRNMDKLDSYRMDMDYYYQDQKLMSSYAKVAANYQQIHIEGEVISIYEIDGDYYTVEDYMGFPVLMLDEEYGDDEEDYDDFNLLLDADFEEDGDYYVLSGDLFEDVSEIRIKVEDRYVIEMQFDIYLDGLDLEVVIEFSDFDDADVRFEYYITNTEKAQLESHATVNGVNEIMTHLDGFSVFSDIVADCDMSDMTCFLEAEPGLDYDLDNQEVRLQDIGTWQPYASFVDTIDSDDITIEYFEMLNFVAELYDKYK